MKRISFLIIALFIFSSCQPKEEEVVVSLPEMDSPPPPPPKEKIVSEYGTMEAQTIAQINTKDRKIIKDGDISLKTGDIQASKKLLANQLGTYKAYIENENYQKDETEIRLNLTCKIPAESFDAFLTKLEDTDNEIISKNINTRDATAEYVDLESRIKVKNEYLAKYESMLKKANTVTALLEIEKEIRTIIEEKESQMAQLKSLQNQVSFSTLNVTFVQSVPYKYKPQDQASFYQELKAAIANGWTKLSNTVLHILSLWPFIILVVLGYGMYKKYFRKLKN